MTPGDLAERISKGKELILLDVREPWEFETCHIAGSITMPMHTVLERMNELNFDDEIICICHYGMRSMQVALLLERKGFEKMNNLAGGLDTWARQIDPEMPVY